MTGRHYMFFVANYRPDFDLAKLGVMRRWCLIGMFHYG